MCAHAKYIVRIPIARQSKLAMLFYVVRGQREELILPLPHPSHRQGEMCSSYYSAGGALEDDWPGQVHSSISF